MLKDSKNALPDLARLLASINSAPDTGLLVVSNNRRGLSVVSGQSLLQCLGVVIRALDKRLPSDVVGHLLLRWVEDFVVGSSRARVDQSARYPRNKKTVINLEFDGMLQRLLAFAKHVIQSFSLSNCTREPVKDETVKRQGGKMLRQ